METFFNFWLPLFSLYFLENERAGDGALQAVAAPRFFLLLFRIPFLYPYSSYLRVTTVLPVLWCFGSYSYNFMFGEGGRGRVFFLVKQKVFSVSRPKRGKKWFISTHLSRRRAAKGRGRQARRDPARRGGDSYGSGGSGGTLGREGRRW